MSVPSPAPTSAFKSLSVLLLPDTGGATLEQDLRGSAGLPTGDSLEHDAAAASATTAGRE